MKKTILSMICCLALLTGCDGNTSSSTDTSSDTTSKVESYALTVTADEGVASVVITSDGVEVEDIQAVDAGTNLVATVELVDHHDLVSVSLDEVALTADEGTKSYPFVMPEADATLTVVTSETSYVITIDNDETKGSVTLYDATSGEVKTDLAYHYGDSLKVVVIPESGYVTETVVVNGVSHELDGNSSYTFDAEFGNFTIESVYLANSPLTYSKTTFASSLSKYEVVPEGVENFVSGDAVLEGTTVHVTIQYDWLSDNVGSYLLYVNDECIPFTAEDLDTAMTSATIEFAMPAEATEVVLTFNQAYVPTAENPVAVTIEYDSANLDLYGYVEGAVYDFTNYKYMQLVFIARSENYTFDKVTATFTDGTTSSISSQFRNGVCEFSYYNYSKTLSGLVFEGSLKEIYTINYVGIESVDDLLLAWGGEVATTGMEGEYIHCESVSSNVEGKYIKEIVITSEDENFDPYISGPSTWNIYWSWNFTMPSADVTITITLADSPTITVNGEHFTYEFRSDSYSSGSVITSPYPGQNIFVWFHTDEGYLVSTVQVDGENVDVFTGTNYTTYEEYAYINFKMPETNVVIDVTCTTAHSVTLSYDSTQVNASLPKGNSYAEGATVSISVSAKNALYQITDVYVQDHPEIIVTKGSYYTFKMPAEDVVVVIEAESTPTLDVTLEVVGGENGTFTFSNYQSNVSITQDSTSFDMSLVANTSNSINVKPATGYQASLSYFVGESIETATEKVVSPTSISGGTYYFNFTTPADLVGVKLTFSEAAPVQIIIDNQTGDDLTYTYTVNKESADNLDAVYVGDYFSIAVNETPADGYQYKIVVKNASGVEVSNSTYYGGYAVSGDMTVTITKYAAYTLTVDIDSSLSNVSASLYTQNYSSYTNGSIIPEGTSVRFSLSYYGATPVDVTITVGGEVLYEFVGIDSYFYHQDEDHNYIYWEVTGNVVITVVPSSSN